MDNSPFANTMWSLLKVVTNALVGKKYLWELTFVTLTFARKSTMIWRNELEV
jgi:hypothetical protein